MRLEKIIFICLFICALSTHLNAAEDVEQLLKSENWRERERAISVIHKDTEGYKTNASVKNLLLNILTNENARQKSLLENNLVAPNEGRGEYYLDVLEIVIKLKIEGSKDALLNSIEHGGAVLSTIVDILINEDNNDLDTLTKIEDKFMSQEMFYKDKRVAFLIMINNYLNKQKSIPPNKKEIIKKLIFNGLISAKSLERQYAIKTSKHFSGDKQIIDELKKIAKTDNYIEPKNGLETYPVREEAKRVLKELGEK